jgi:peptidoglycan/LPS O-acetylase OafA/YrhL
MTDAWWSFSRSARALRGAGTGALTALDGLRFISALWIVTFHCLVLVLEFLPDRSVAEGAVYSLPFRVVINGTLAVDLFFILSGFLVYGMLAREPVTLAGTARFYGRRLLRLVPALAVALALYVGALSATAPGDTAGRQVVVCAESWWRTLLLVSNFFPPIDTCMAWAWTVAMEAQFYAASPVIVLAAQRWPRAGTPMLVAIIAASMAGYIAATFVSYAGLTGGASWQEDVYQKPHTRLFAYALGMLVARLLAFEWKSSRPLRVALRVVSSLLAIGVAVGVDNYSRAPVAHLAFGRPVFVMAMSYALYDLLSPGTEDAYTRAAVRVLGSFPLRVLSQFTYSVYLVHITVILAFYGFLITDLVGGGVLAFQPFWMLPVCTFLVYCISSIIAVVIFFLIERPCISWGMDRLRPAPAPSVLPS